MNKRKKGVILGITAISLLLVFLVGTLVFSLILSEDSKYKNYNTQIQKRLYVKTITQEAYVSIYPLIDGVLEINEEIEQAIITINNKYDENLEDDLYVVSLEIIDDKFFINVSYSGFVSTMQIGREGKISEWKIT